MLFTRVFSKNGIKFLYNYVSGAWIKVTSHAKSRVISGVRSVGAGLNGHARAL